MDLQEATMRALQGKLTEDTQNEIKGTEVELHGIKRTLYSQDEVDCFNAMKRTVDVLDTFVTNWNISLSMGTSYAYCVFKTRDGQGEFEVTFSTESFGKVENIKTTFSSQNVTDNFIKLASLLKDMEA